MNRIKEIRKSKGYSQKDVADAIGVTQSQYSRYESGATNIPGDMLPKIADILKVSVDMLLGRQEPAEPPQWTQIEIKPELIPEDEVLIPVVASLRCGFNSAGEPMTFTDRKPVPISWTKRWGTNIVFVNSVGDSMIPTIRPGDLCVCVPGEAWESGQIVVVDINDSDTIKRIKRTPDGGIDLIPDNPEFDVMHLSPEDLSRFQVRVLGRIVKVIGPDL